MRWNARGADPQRRARSQGLRPWQEGRCTFLARREASAAATWSHGTTMAASMPGSVEGPTLTGSREIAVGLGLIRPRALVAGKMERLPMLATTSTIRSSRGRELFESSTRSTLRCTRAPCSLAGLFAATSHLRMRSATTRQAIERARRRPGTPLRAQVGTLVVLVPYRAKRRPARCSPRHPAASVRCS